MLRRTLALAFVCLASIVVSPAHAAEAPIGRDTRFGAISSGGRLRQYRLYVPSVAKTASVPLVFVLHGGIGNPFQVARNTGFDEEAEKRGFIAVYPWGIANTWNAGTCCGRAMKDDVDDVGFIGDLLDDISARYRVDTGRVFATGMSNGGMMSYRLGCELSERIAAIAPVASTMTSACSPSRSVAVLHIHGLDDEHVPYEGGVGSEGLAKDYRQAVPKAIARWRAINGCPDATTTHRGEVTTSTSEPCNNRTAVTLITIDGAGHTWPGSNRRGASDVVVDPANGEIEATNVISNFFAAHSRA